MNRLLVFLGMTLGGYLGWWAGEALAFGLMGTLLVSSLGSIAGIFGAWKIVRMFLDN
jgi:hypothetical protein